MPKDMPVISADNFDERVTKGEKLVILDDMVLDVTSFEYNHPGGTFLIKQNIGRDISKFFYGGYVLSNYKGAKPYNHSNFARLQVNSMIIGILEKKIDSSSFKIQEVSKVNDLTSTFVFKSNQS